MMIKFLAIWLADRCGLFEETEAAANAYLQSKSAYETAEEGWRSRLAEAKRDVEFYRGITARDLGFQRTIATRLGCLDDSLNLGDQMSKTIETVTRVADEVPLDRAFLDKLVTILIGPDAVCGDTPVDVQQSVVIDAAEKLSIEHKYQTQTLKEFQRIGGEFVAISGRSGVEIMAMPNASQKQALRGYN